MTVLNWVPTAEECNGAAERFRTVVAKNTLKAGSSSPGHPKIWAPEVETLPREQLEALQEERLAAAFDYVIHCSPLFRARYTELGLRPGDIKTLADLKKLPVIGRNDIEGSAAAAPPWGTWSPLTDHAFRERGWMVFHSSGSTGKQLFRRGTVQDRELWGWVAARALWAYGVRPGALAVSFFPYGHSTAAWSMHEGLGRLGCPVFSGFAGAMSSPERRAEILAGMAPQVILGGPSMLLVLARELKENNIDPASLNVRFLLCAGEPGACVPAVKRRLIELWGAPLVHDNFGSAEVASAPLGFTCSAVDTLDEGLYFHITEDMYIAEVLDPATLEPVAKGAPGTLVVSNISSESSAILRYNMGDISSLSEAGCPCGRTLMRAGGVEGRADHSMTIGGRTITRAALENVLRMTGLGDEYCVERDGKDTFAVVIERSGNSTVDAESVQKQVEERLGVQLAVRVVEPGTLPRSLGKAKRFVVTS